MEEHPADVSSSIRTLPPKKKSMLIGGGILFVIVYAAVNVMLWRYARMNRQPDQNVVIENGAPQKDGSAPISLRTVLPTTTPTPTPRPTGPGRYACSTLGTCKDFADAIRSTKCSITFADDHCLDQCTDVTKRCKN